MNSSAASSGILVRQVRPVRESVRERVRARDLDRDGERARARMRQKGGGGEKERERENVRSSLSPSEQCPCVMSGLATLTHACTESTADRPRGRPSKAKFEGVGGVDMSSGLSTPFERDGDFWRAFMTEVSPVV